MKEEDIELFNTYNETKASIVERLIRTLKTKMWCYFTAQKTMWYVDMLPDIVYSYNHSVHRSIKMKPADVTTENEKEVWHTLYDDHKIVKNIKYKFKIGDQDLDSEELKGTFYEKELQKIIKKDNVYEVEKILKKRGQGKNVHYFVKWLGREHIMSGTHFYLTRPSNVSLDVFPDNKTSDYHVQLPQSINLNRNWEVGMYSISYPHRWYTFKNNAEFYYDDGSGFFPVTLASYGHYEHVQALLDSMNAFLKKYAGNDNINLTYSSQTGKVTGYGGKTVTISTTGESPHTADLNIFSTIYTYCNIVQPQTVGNTNAQLLPVKGKYGDIVTKTFTNVQYIPVQTKSFENVEILLRNDTGDPVPFERGKEAAKARAMEAANTAKGKAISKLQGQTDVARAESEQHVKRERHQRPPPDVDRPRNGKQLKTYSAKNMNFVHSRSQECAKSKLDLFSVPPTQISLEKGHWIDHQPVASLANGGAFTFLSPGTEDYVDLARTILVIRAKVTKANGTNLGANEKVGVVNNLLHSLFKQVDVFLKGKQVTQATSTYAYSGNPSQLQSLRKRFPAYRRPVLQAYGSGFVPKTLVFGLVDGDTFNSALKKNLFNFKPSMEKQAINGEEIPFKPMKLSFGAAPQYIEAFSTMFSGTGKMYHNTGNDISRSEFPNGYAIYAFDLTPDMCGASTHFNVVQRGNLAIDIQFSAAPAAAASLVCYGEFESTVHIDSERNVIYDYSG
ncbi:uncharacterized transposon-derived [Paramuricea clavata]|uniref:Uncharacterized transposon-derived n=1 Tax=Paramuricea clavata TaxID=317549 RepID=A0A6S7GUI1_PARCT|nr:uncharacterized transposon-derived [Paramuricea clavata]